MARISKPSKPDVKSETTTAAQLVPAVSSIVDLIIPGVGLAISIVLGALNELCRRLLKRKHERILKVNERLNDLYNHVRDMEATGRVSSAQWLHKYGDVVARFRGFMDRCEQRHVLLRLVRGGKERKEVQQFEDDVYALYQAMDFKIKPGCCLQ